MPCSLGIILRTAHGHAMPCAITCKTACHCHDVHCPSDTWSSRCQWKSCIRRGWSFVWAVPSCLTSCTMQHSRVNTRECCLLVLLHPTPVTGWHQPVVQIGMAEAGGHLRSRIRSFAVAPDGQLGLGPARPRQHDKHTGVYAGGRGAP